MIIVKWYWSHCQQVLKEKIAPQQQKREEKSIHLFCTVFFIITAATKWKE